MEANRAKHPRGKVQDNRSQSIGEGFERLKKNGKRQSSSGQGVRVARPRVLPQFTQSFGTSMLIRKKNKPEVLVHCRQAL